MSQIYSDPTREHDEHALPNVETFYLNGDGSILDENDEPMTQGWYYWFCFPGCLSDGEPMGPFETETLAIADAQSE